MSDALRRRLWRDSSAALPRTWGDSDFSGFGRNWGRDTNIRDGGGPVALRDVVPPYEPQPVREPAAVVEPLRPMVELVVVVATDDGSPVVDARLEVDGQTLTTDADGRAAITLRADTYEIRFAEPPALGPLGDGPGPRTILVESNRAEPFHLSTGGPRHVVVRRPRCTEILVDGYAKGSKVLRWGGTRQRLDDGPDGAPIPVVGTTRAALATALLRGRGQYAVVVGHADPQGSDASNAEVALQRARSTFLYCSGQLDLWAAHAAGSASELDFNCAMVACSTIVTHADGTPFERPALDDPAAIRRTSAALRRWGGDATAGPSPLPTGTPDDWRLVAEAYEVDLARILGVETIDVERLRQQITWIGVGHGQLGERFPRPRTEIDVVSQVGLPYAVAQRRSAVVLMGRPDAEILADGDVLEPMYDGTWGRLTIDTPTEAPLVLRCVDRSGKALPHARLWLSGPLGVQCHVADAIGVVSTLTIRGTKFDVALARDAHDEGVLERVEVGRG